jgi:monovalent cation:proton antiporter-2 (CPA2) family protein
LSLVQILAILTAAVVAVTLFQRLKLGSVLGYLAAGIVLGPHLLGIVKQVEVVRHFAEFGVVLLLFLIGIEMKPARLWVMRRLVFGLGLLQWMGTGLVLSLICWLLGIEPRLALVIGLSLALSSTAFGLQLMTERGDLGNVVGRSGLAVLLLQDLAVIPLLTLVAVFAGGSDLASGIGFALLESAAIVAGVIIITRVLLEPFLKTVASSRQSETFAAAALLLVLGIGAAMEYAGLSMALGAFLAGVMLADSHYRHQVTADIMPFRSLLLGLFFMAVGMTMDLRMLLVDGWWLVPATAGLLGIKTVMAWMAGRLFGLSTTRSLRFALLISQAGEFGFVLFSVAFADGLLQNEIVQRLNLMIGLSMVATPFLVRLGDALSERLEAGNDEQPSPPTSPDTHPVLIAGFGQVGQRIGTLLYEAKVPYLAIDSDADTVAKARGKGHDVLYGDVSRIDLLHAAGVERAALVVIAVDRPKAAEQLVAMLRQRFPHLPIIVRGQDRDHCAALRRCGATTVVSENLEASIRLGEQVLQERGIAANKTRRIVDNFRSAYYHLLAEETPLGTSAKQSQSESGPVAEKRDPEALPKSSA